MNQHLTGKLVAVGLIAALLLVLTNTWARQASVFSHLDLFVDVRHELVNNYVETLDQQELMEAAIRGMIGSLDDPHTSFLTAEDLDAFDQQVRGSFSGIGAEVEMHENRIRILTPLEDSPAWEAGVMPGDIILRIDGTSTEGMDLMEGVRHLTGEAGTDVTIDVRRETGEEERITITRDVIEVQSVRGFRRNADNHFDFFIDPDSRIGYIRITQFTERTADELREALHNLRDQDARGLIVDVRFNPGGLLDSAVEIADMFLPPGDTIVSVEGRSIREETSHSRGDPVLPDVPLLVVGNETSASAAEILAGAIKDNGRGLYLGTRTFGKGSVQGVHRLESGQGALKITNAYYLIPSGRIIHRRDDSETWGVDPNEGAFVPMSRQQQLQMQRLRRESDQVGPSNGDRPDKPVTPEFIEEQLGDPQLAAALEAMLGKLDTGDWPQVGHTDVEAQVAVSEQANLREERSQLLTRLAEIEDELGEVPDEAELDSQDAETDQEDAEQPQPQPQP